jgi:hypothetical protein
MKSMWPFSILLLLISVVTPAAWRQRSQSRCGAAMAGDDWSELMGSMDKMHAAIGSVEPSGDSDADFVRLMLPHHQGAIDMAKTQLLFGKDPQMRRLARPQGACWANAHGSKKKNGNQRIIFMLVLLARVRGLASDLLSANWAHVALAKVASIQFPIADP